MDNYADRSGNRNIYFAVEDKCFQLSVNDGRDVCEEITELNNNHEKADTRLLLHAKHASENCEITIIIKSQDTDATALACHFCSNISEYQNDPYPEEREDEERLFGDFCPN